MLSIIDVLENIRKNSMVNDFETNGYFFGKKWFNDKKIEIPKCYITSRITRSVIAQAAQENIKLIISIYPPIFTRGYDQKVDDDQIDLLKILIENKICIYSLGEKWLVAEDGGFDYLFDLLEFQYKSIAIIKFIDRCGYEEYLIGRLAERKSKLKLIELLSMLKQFSNQDINYIGFNELPVQKVSIFNEILSPEIILEINQSQTTDVVIVGELTYDAFLAAQLVKLPLIVLEKRNLENLIISRIRRKLLEEVTLNSPEIIIKKQEKIGSIFQ